MALVLSAAPSTPSAGRAAEVWVAQAVETSPEVGFYTSLELTSQGAPCIAYVDTTGAIDRIRYAVRNAGTWTIETVDSTNRGYAFTSLALDALDRPHIVYYDWTATTGFLKYATKAPGGPWGIENVDANGDVGAYCSVALDGQGVPHVSYGDFTNPSDVSLKYARRQFGSWSTQTVDADQSVGYYTSIAIDALDRAHMTYYDVTNGNLKYAYPAGSFWLPQVVDATGDVGWYSSLCLDSTGTAFVAYYDNTRRDLKLATRVAGTWMLEVADSSQQFTGNWCSLRLAPGAVPSISYRARTLPGNDRLKYASRRDGVWTTTVVDTAGSTGHFSSLALQGTLPRIAYYTLTTKDCMFSELVPAIDACQVVADWNAGPAIRVIQPLRHSPTIATGLKSLRPGDVIAFSIVAEDRDWLVQTCTDCDDLPFTRKWGPYADRLDYRWSLRAGNPGHLILPPGPERTAILYQLPFCNVPLNVNQVAQIDLVIANDSTTAKSSDSPYVGTVITISYQLKCGPDRKGPGYIDATVIVTNGSQNDDVPVTEGGPGLCLPQPPQWSAATPMHVAELDTIVAPNLCPGRMILVTAAASDSDQVTLTCLDPRPYCQPGTMTLTTGDPIVYQWSEQGMTSAFPVGTLGPVVAFKRSQSLPRTVSCEITDSGTQAGDGTATRVRGVGLARKPKALVAVGRITDVFGDPIEDAIDAAERAVQHYEERGYEVDYRRYATEGAVDSALRDPCIQALWVTGHGNPGSIDLLPGQGAQFSRANLHGAAFGTWGCPDGVHPTLLEVALVGCNTTGRNSEIREKLACARLYTFNHKLFGGWYAWTVGHSAEKWERDVHQCEPCHDP